MSSVGKRSVSAYRRIYETLRARASSGKQSTASETELMEEFSVSRDTARKALNLLTRDGFARRIQGRGTVLAAAPTEAPRFDIQVPVNERFFRGIQREPLRHKFFELMDGVLGGEGETCRVHIPLLRPADSLAKQFADLSQSGGGVLFLSPSGLEDLIALMRRERYPHMVHTPSDYEGNSVSSDTEAGIRRAVETLADKGRRRILFVSPSHQGPWHAPMRGTWAKTLARRKLDAGDELIFDIDSQMQEDPEELASALRSRRFDAVFSTEAEISLRLLKALSLIGRIPGKTVSFISYEDLPEFETMKPAISAVRVPLARIGARLRDELLSMMRFGYRDNMRVSLEEELVLRGSE